MRDLAPKQLGLWKNFTAKTSNGDKPTNAPPIHEKIVSFFQLRNTPPATFMFVNGDTLDTELKSTKDSQIPEIVIFKSPGRDS